MRIRKEHELAGRNYDYSFVLRIESSESPSRVANIVSMYDAKDACAIIDKMHPLSAVFVLCMLQMRARKGDDVAGRIVNRAKKLRIQGVMGLRCARDEIYELTRVHLF
jgi:hypothetical protein